MALRKRGKQGFWHAYFRTVTARKDGQLQYKLTTVNLGTTDLLQARAMEQELMAKNRKARLHQRFLATMTALELAAESETPGAVPATPAPLREHRRKRLKLADWRQAAEKYKAVSKDQAKIFDRFVRSCGVTYADQVTPELAFSYLNGRYGAPEKGKSFNNNRFALNAVFKVLLLEAGIPESPFAKIPVRQHQAEHQRPFSEEEFKRIHAAAPEPWKTACLIAWFTGMREESVFNLKWANIEGDIITVKPGKTARYGRAVEIPMHPQMAEAIAKLPRTSEYVLGLPPEKRNCGSFHHAFGKILDSLGIVDDVRGIVNFNCFRDSFITRCDRARIPRHATRGVVGKISDETTDLYSHDLETARLIQELPRVELEE